MITTSLVALTTTKNQLIPIIVSSLKAILSRTTIPQYILYNSFILDLGVINHVYNKRERFSKFRKAYPDDIIYTRDLIIPIKE